MHQMANLEMTEKLEQITCLPDCNKLQAKNSSNNPADLYGQGHFSSVGASSKDKQLATRRRPCSDIDSWALIDVFGQIGDVLPY